MIHTACAPIQDTLFKEYIDLASSIPTFGMNLYNVFDGEYDKGGVKRRLGIGEDGIMLSRRGEKVLVLCHVCVRLFLTFMFRMCMISTLGQKWADGSRQAIHYLMLK